MLTNIHLWKHSFFKVCPAQDHHPFYMDDNLMPHYPIKWTLPKRHRDWDFKKLSLDNKNFVAQLLAMVPFDA